MKLAALLPFSFGALATIACGAEPASIASEEVAADEAALSSCGSAKYNEALAHYKNAVAWSKDRLAKGVCESENGYLWGIADESSLAVMTCGDFRNTIRTSIWAAPLRQVLAPSLTLRSLTGELLVIKDSQWQNWAGTEKFFQSGLTFWARAEGAYGFAVRIEFRANGDATWGELRYDEATGDITWGTEPATYTIAKTTERAKRTITVKHAAKTNTYVLGVESGWTYDAAPLFTLTPAGTNAATQKKLYSLVSECDA
jgi:hypothetical protein